MSLRVGTAFQISHHVLVPDVLPLGHGAADPGWFGARCHQLGGARLQHPHADVRMAGGECTRLRPLNDAHCTAVPEQRTAHVHAETAPVPPSERSVLPADTPGDARRENELEASTAIPEGDRGEGAEAVTHIFSEGVDVAHLPTTLSESPVASLRRVREQWHGADTRSRHRAPSLPAKVGRSLRIGSLVQPRVPSGQRRLELRAGPLFFNGLEAIGTWLCEAALWTLWGHVGTCLAVPDFRGARGHAAEESQEPPTLVTRGLGLRKGLPRARRSSEASKSRVSERCLCAERRHSIDHHEHGPSGQGFVWFALPGQG